MALKLCKVQAKDYGIQKGRPLCRLECEEKNLDLTTSNIVEIEKSPATPQQVKWFIGKIWETLALPGCSIDTDLLRYVMDFESGCEGNATFWDRTSDVRESGKKIGKRANSWVLECGMPPKSNDYMENFFRSKLGILFLRGMIHLSSMWTPPQKTGKISQHLLDSMDKQFMQSPLCCLFVKDIQVEVSTPGSGKSAVRTNVKMKRAVPDLVADFAPETPSYETLEKAPADSFSVYGQLMSGYAGCLGDYYCSADEYETRKRGIEHNWKAMESRNQYESTKKKYKWFDNFAGTEHFGKAAIKLIVMDSPPVSLWATLSNIKRNLLCLAYMCRVYMASVRDNRSSLYSNSSDRKELLTDMAEFVTSFFTEDASLALTNNFPLRISKQIKMPYLSLKDYMVKPMGGLDSMQFLKKIQNLGITSQDVLHTLSNTEGKTITHVPFYNALSKCEMSHQERVSLTDRGHEENRSLVLVPIKLSSWEQNTCCKFSAGVKTWFGNSPNYGVLVGKSSMLFDKNDSASSTISADEQIQQLAESYKLLIDDGMTSDEAATAMSLTSQQQEKVVQYLESNDDEMPAKRRRF